MTQEFTAGQLEAAFPEIHPPFAPQEAVVEANRCLYCFDAPCANACPTHIDVPRFIKKIASGNLRGSALAILDANILGLSCSRVCPVDVLCEGACVLHRYNKKPIEIGRLQRHAMDKFYQSGARLAFSAAARPGRVACIGAGPASLACAAELRRLGLAVTIFEAQPLAGGLNTHGVAEYKLRSPDSLREVEFIRSLGVEFRTGIRVGEDVALDVLEREFDAIFVGVGLGPAQDLRIPGEHLSGVVDAVAFIAGYKVSRRAPAGKRVVVIGGGNTAIDAAVAAKLLGAEEVTIVYRRGESEMSAFKFEYEHAKNHGVRFFWRTKPVSISGGPCVTGLDCAVIDGANFTIPCDTVIRAIGQTKFAGLFAGRATDPRYFAGGDCVNGGREVVDAVAEGKRAAGKISAWLEKANG